MINKTDKYHEIINLGLQPVSNRYNKDCDKKCLKTKLVLEQSNETGIIKLKNSKDPIIYKPLVDWIKYNEPEPHLDKFVQKILNGRKIERIAPISTIFGLNESSRRDQFLKTKYQSMFI